MLISLYKLVQDLFVCLFNYDFDWYCYYHMLLIVKSLQSKSEVNNLLTVITHYKNLANLTVSPPHLVHSLLAVYWSKVIYSLCDKFMDTLVFGASICTWDQGTRTFTCFQKPCTHTGTHDPCTHTLGTHVRVLVLAFWSHVLVNSYSVFQCKDNQRGWCVWTIRISIWKEAI